MGLKKLIAVGMAVLVALNMGMGAAVAATNTGGTVQSLSASSTDTTHVNATVTSGPEKVEESLTLKTKTVEGGDNPPANWTVTGPNGTEYTETDSSTIEFTPEYAGNYDVNFTVTKEGNYSENGATVNVTKQEQYTKLAINNGGSNVQPNDTVEFKATSSGGSLVNGTLEFNNRSVPIHGTGDVTFDEAGTHNVTLVPNDTRVYDYYTDADDATYERTITVSYDEVGLNLVVQDTSGNSGGPFIPNETIEFVVTRSNDSADVANATVVVNNETYETNETGVATANITDVGSFQANATKNTTDGVQYLNGTATFNVSRVEEDLVLDIYDASGNENTTFVPGDEIVFDLDDTDSHSVANATITVANKTLVTNESGGANTTINETGEFVVNATTRPNTTTKYKPVSKNITLDRYNESLTLAMYNESGANTTAFEPGEEIEFVTAPNATLVVDNESYETGVNGTVNETFYKNGEYNVTVTKAHNLTTEYENVSGTFTVNGTEVWVNATTAGSEHVSVNETVPGNLSLNVAPKGLAGYNVILTIGDNATFSDATNSTAFELTNVSVRENGSVVEYDAVDLDEDVQAGDEDVDLGSFEIVGEHDGPANITVEVEDIESGNETAVDAGTDGAPVEVIDPPTVTNGTDVSDPDDDGAYEDLNGNGEVDYDDTVSLFESREDEQIQENAELFDYTGDGTVGYSDIIAVYEMTDTAGGSDGS